MKKFHITYFIQEKPCPKLTGVTVHAPDISEAIFQFVLETGIELELIKYVIEL